MDTKKTLEMYLHTIKHRKEDLRNKQIIQTAENAKELDMLMAWEDSIEVIITQMEKEKINEKI